MIAVPPKLGGRRPIFRNTAAGIRSQFTLKSIKLRFVGAAASEAGWQSLQSSSDTCTIRRRYRRKSVTDGAIFMTLPKRILVTGGAGYVGSRVTAQLLERGYAVTAFDKLVYGGEALLPFNRRERFTLVKGDVRDRDAIAAALSGIDAVVHLAAVVGEPACAADTKQSWSINVDGTKSVLAAARAAQTERLIFVSTCSNYGVAEPGQLATEDSTLNPLSNYSCAKVECEKIVLAEASPPASAILRFATICGLSARMRFDLLVNEMAKSCARGKKIHIFSPAAWRPFLHIADATYAIEHILKSSPNLTARRVFNVVGENYQKRGLLELARRHFPQIEIAVNDKEPDLRDYRVSGSRITRELGFVPRCTVEDAFCETAKAVSDGVFRDPDWPGHSAISLASCGVHG
jgi:nucleoside-diphosphate-sugar epimerase